MNGRLSVCAFGEVIAVEPLSVKVPASLVVADMAGILARLTFTPERPAVAPVFLTVPDRFYGLSLNKKAAC